MSQLYLPSNPNPDYPSDFARNSEESAFPKMWDGLVVAYVPFFGPDGSLRNIVTGELSTLTNMDVTDWQGDALNFGGTDEFVGGEDVSQVVSEITVAAWFNVSSFISADYDIVSEWDVLTENTFDLRLDFNAGKHRPTFTVRTVNEAHPDVYGNVFLQDLGGIGTWFRIVGVYSSAGIFKIYLNGFDISGTPEGATGNLGTGTDVLKIGHALAGGNQFFDGLIRQVLVYNRAFNDNEVAVWSANPKGLFILRRRYYGFVEPAVGVRAARYYRMLLQGDRV